MTDPAMEAVQRAGDENDGWPWDTTRDAMYMAAQEALAPIQSWYHKALFIAEDDDLYDQIDLLETLAPLLGIKND